MYKFKRELKKELLKGRSIKYISETAGVAYPNLSRFLNGEKVGKKVTAYAITKAFDKELEIVDIFEIVE